MKSPASTPGSSTRFATWWLSPMNWPPSGNSCARAAARTSSRTCSAGPRSGASPTVQLAHLWGGDEEHLAQMRREHGINPVYKLVDTCAAEFEAYTPYFYSTYEWEDEARQTTGDKVMILGGGPNRIGQGIEFDYCCCQASFALKEIGVESIMVNSNPETVSTDYDTSDKLYFEPLTREDVLHIVAAEQPLGLILQFGGQTPLNLAVPLGQAGVRIMGTGAEAIDRAEDRQLFKQTVE